jgi:hypothetical protein
MAKLLAPKNHYTALNLSNSNKVGVTTARKSLCGQNGSRLVGGDSRDNSNRVCGERRDARQEKNDEYSHGAKRPNEKS